MVSLWWVTYQDGKNMKCGLIVMGDLPKWKEERVVSFFGWPTQGKDGLILWVTYPGKKKMENGLILWVTYPEKMVVSLWWVTYPGGKRKEWSHSLGDLPRGRMASFFGWPTQVKQKWKLVSFFGWPTQKKNGGLIVMGDLPRWKNGKMEKRSYYDGWPTQMERMWNAVSL